MKSEGLAEVDRLWLSLDQQSTQLRGLYQLMSDASAVMADLSDRIASLERRLK